MYLCDLKAWPQMVLNTLFFSTPGSLWCQWEQISPIWSSPSPPTCCSNLLFSLQTEHELGTSVRWLRIILMCELWKANLESENKNTKLELSISPLTWQLIWDNALSQMTLWCREEALLVIWFYRDVTEWCFFGGGGCHQSLVELRFISNSWYNPPPAAFVILNTEHDDQYLLKWEATSWRFWTLWHSCKSKFIFIREAFISAVTLPGWGAYSLHLEICLWHRLCFNKLLQCFSVCSVHVIMSFVSTCIHRQ